LKIKLRGSFVAKDEGRGRRKLGRGEEVYIEGGYPSR
jgi:hypothetical protein